MDARRTTEERYLSARQTSNLGLNLERPCDADALLAAAYAVSGSDRKRLALAAYSVLASPSMRGARPVAEELGGWLVRRSLKRKGRPLKRIQGRDMALRLLTLWHKRTCPECLGRGHPLMGNSPVLDETRDCPACRGSGLIPIERLFDQEAAPLMRELEGEINALCSMVMSDMARLLSARMEEFQ